MRDSLIDEIPPYQALDIALGRHIGVSIPPVSGWVIAHPALGAEMYESEKDADARLAEIACAGIKHAASKFKAWIHEQESIFFHISNRKHWTPR